MRLKDWTLIGGARFHHTEADPEVVVFYSCPVCAAALAYTDHDPNALARHRAWHESSSPSSAPDAEGGPK